MIARGDVRWVSFGPPTGSGPGYRRPAVVVSADSFNSSAINTVVVAVMSSNLSLQLAPGNVLVPAVRSGLPKDSVVNVSQLATIDKRLLDQAVGALDVDTMDEVERGLRLVLQLDVA